MSRPLRREEVEAAQGTMAMALDALEKFRAIANPSLDDLKGFSCALRCQALELHVMTLEDLEGRRVARAHLATVKRECVQKPPDPPGVPCTALECPPPPEGDLWFQKGSYG